MRKPILPFLSIVIVIAIISSCENRTTTTENEKNTTVESEKSITTNLKPAATIDIDGNVYDTVHIGTQVWMKENLKTAHYRDGTAIQKIKGGEAWANIYYTGSQTSAWCYYNGDTSNNSIYGKLYNWYAVTNKHGLCPIGWHVPSDAEWHKLAITLDSVAKRGEVESAIAGGEMKAITLWDSPNMGATNSSGFTALPAGARNGEGDFGALGNLAVFWSSTTSGSNNAWSRTLDSKISGCYRANDYKGSGFSVRCVKD